MADPRIDALAAAVTAALAATPGADPAATGHPEPLRCFRAPGRVNLIGGHVDYQEGPVIPLAIDRDVVVAARPRRDGRFAVHSLDLDGTVDVPAGGTTDLPDVAPAWGRIVGAVLHTLAERGCPPAGADIVVGSDLPIGAGLSSSAAFEVALALAACNAAAFDLPPRELALACQEAEHLASGVPCGVQDQMASLCGVEGHALLLDCRTLAVEPLPLPPSLRVLVVHSGVPRSLADSPYALRRAEAEAVAARLGLRALRDATPDQVAADPRGRHVVSEMGRVLAFAAALRDGDLAALGPLMLAGHASLRDDMEVSTPDLDALVECLMDAGALGARLTGGGFGGSVVSLVPAGRVDEIASTACASYRARRGREPTPWPVRGAAAAGPVEHLDQNR